MLVLEAGKALNSGAAGLAYADCIFSMGSSGYLVRSKPFILESGFYSMTVVGETFEHTGLSRSLLRISDDRYNRTCHLQDLMSARGGGNEICSTIFNVPEGLGSIYCEIDVPETVSLRIDSISIDRSEYLYEFAIVNKSYLNDLRWSIALFRSWNRFAVTKSPFFIVVPEADLRVFEDAFFTEQRLGHINCLPNLMTEEWLFDRIGICIPGDFTGWHTQQIVKLGFSKTRIARNYLTLDSSIVFTKRFDPALLFSNGAMYTAARTVSKEQFFSDLERSREQGWLHGEIVNISESFKWICDFMENESAETNAYISCTGMFSSELCHRLESFARERDIDGFTGLIQIAPYEFAWYGEFVYARQRSRFEPHDPHLMTLAHTTDDLTAIMSGRLSSSDHHLGVMFQPPATSSADPDAIYRIVETGVLR